MPKGVGFKNQVEEAEFNFRNTAGKRGETRRKPLVFGKNTRGKAPPIPKGDPRSSNEAGELLSATGRHYTEAVERSKRSRREGINRVHSMKAKKWANYAKARKLLTGVNKAMREDPEMKNIFSPIVNTKARKEFEEYYNNANIQNVINTRGRSKRNQKEALERGVADLLEVSNWKKHIDPASGFPYWHSEHFGLSHWNVNGRNGWKKLESKGVPYWVHEKKGMYHFENATVSGAAAASGPAGGGKRTRRKQR